jgi:hypothetical protein
MTPQEYELMSGYQKEMLIEMAKIRRAIEALKED